MKARALIEGASFGPETVKAMGAAFDQAWARVVRIYGDSPDQVEAARLRLAEAVLSVANDGNTDIAGLKADALYAMAKHYGSRA